MVIDFQHHYIPPELAAKHGVQRGQKVILTEGGKPRINMAGQICDLDQQVRDMKIAGIDVSVLSCPLGWDVPLEECKIVNDAYAVAQNANPKTFVGLAHVPVHEGRAGLDELNRAIEELGLRGVAIMSQIEGLPLDTPKFRDFFARAMELDIPIFVHPALLPKGYTHALDYDLARLIGREFDLELAVTRLIASGLLEAMPKLKIVIAHFGGGISAIKERLNNKAYRFGTGLKHSFEDNFDLLYFDMAGFEGGTAALRCALTGIKPEQLVFATDYPQDFTGVATNTGKGVEQIRDYIQSVHDIGFSAQVTDAILGGTAARLLKVR